MTALTTRESRRTSLRGRFPPTRPCNIEYSIAGSEDLEDVYRLVYRAFVRRNYVDNSRVERHVHYDGRFDHIPSTVIFLARQKETEMLVGSISATIDSKAGLPAEEDFPEAIARIRRNLGKIYHVWRLAIDPEVVDQSIEITYGLISLSLFSEKLADCAGSTAIIHPRHVPFYRTLECVPIAYQACASGFSNAPAVLIGHVDKRFQMTPEEERKYGLLAA